MSLPFPSLKELAMREVVLKELPREELPMKKELEALDRLPGNYTVEKSTKLINRSKDTLKVTGQSPSDFR